MIVLGIDPGTATTGYAILNINDKTKKPTLLHASTLRTSQDNQMHIRLAQLHNQINEVLKTYNPNLMIIERLFFNTNAKTAMTVGQARGVILLTAAIFGIPVEEYTALQAKKALSGYGRADKKQMQEAVAQFLGLPDIIKQDDANDAAAMTICYYKINYEECKSFISKGK